jgi:hypothetical protein
MEMYSILGNSELVSGIAPLKEQAHLSKNMGKWWYDFAASSDQDDLVGWHTSVPGQKTLGLFGKD